jgi:FdhD protein
MKSLRILRIDGTHREWVEDLVTEEVPLRLLAGARRLATLLCSPADLEDLVRGFFYTNGFIARAGDLRKILINRATWSAFVELAPEIDPEALRLSGVVGSGCGALVPEGEPGWLSAEKLSAFMHEALRASEVHRRTGGVHMAALADASGLLLLREDIGRHNAVDKVIGAHLAAGGSFAEKALLASGRVSSELLLKALRCGVPVLVSRSAPTDRSIALARQGGLTLIGFARGGRLNVYSAHERLFGGRRGIPI